MQYRSAEMFLVIATGLIAYDPPWRSRARAPIVAALASLLAVICVVQLSVSMRDTGLTYGWEDVYDRSPPRPGASRRARILVIDDEDHLRGAVVDVLSGRGHEVEEAATGRAAMAKIETGHYDVITLDLRLPDVDGTAIWEWLLARDPSTAARVVFITGDTMNPDTQTFLQGTGRPVLAKPFTVECLGVAVEAVLAEAPAAAIRDRS